MMVAHMGRLLENLGGIPLLGVLGTYSGSERGSSIGMSDGGSGIGSSVDMHLGRLWERPCWVQIQGQC